MVEINFLCVHKKLRSKRVAPVLIKEITRRVNMVGIFQAVYTAGILIPKPIAVCRYWHRSLNPKKLVDVQFSSLHRHMTLQRMIRLFRLPDVRIIIFLLVIIYWFFLGDQDARSKALSEEGCYSCTENTEWSEPPTHTLLAYSVIWPNFNTVDPMSKMFWFSESLERDLSNDVF